MGSKVELILADQVKVNLHATDRQRIYQAFSHRPARSPRNHQVQHGEGRSVPEYPARPTRRERIQANFGATRKGRSPQESAETLVGAREDEKNDQLQKQLVIDIGGAGTIELSSESLDPQGSR